MHTLRQLQNGELKGITALELTEKLTYFPQEIFDLADSLEYLDLSGNRLTTFPPDFGRLKNSRLCFARAIFLTPCPKY
ncbi:hypothetical protein [Mucilaginibacter antarcticus]|uniref:hypothetical protein n=1 Tax=Mucilaginibacter antarcticus TaxID=1855725 RepID=UPI003641B8D8